MFRRAGLDWRVRDLGDPGLLLLVKRRLDQADQVQEEGDSRSKGLHLGRVEAAPTSGLFSHLSSNNLLSRIFLTIHMYNVYICIKNSPVRPKVAPAS